MVEYDYPTGFGLWHKEEHAAIKRVLDSGRFTMGAEVEAFESEFAAYHGRKHAIMVNSGSSANLIMVAALLHTRADLMGHGVAVPAIAWSTTYAPFVQYGFRLKVIDCDQTWNACKATAHAWDVTPHDDSNNSLKVILACSILGTPAHLEWWSQYARHTGKILLEDNCESLGARTSGRLCGTFGLMSTFSFFYSHQLSAIEGGAVLTDDDNLAYVCRLLRAHGWTRDVIKPETFADEYDFQLFGYNVRPVEMHAAIAREQLKKQEAFAIERRRNRDVFSEMSVGLPIQMQESSGYSNPFGIAFTVENGKRDELIKALRTNSIDCRLPTGGSFMKHRYARDWFSQGQKRFGKKVFIDPLSLPATPSADYIHETGLFLGNAPFPIPELIERATKVMRSVL